MSDQPPKPDTLPSPHAIHTFDITDQQRSVWLSVTSDSWVSSAHMGWVRIVADKTTGEIRCSIHKQFPDPKY